MAINAASALQVQGIAMHGFGNCHLNSRSGTLWGVRIVAFCPKQSVFTEPAACRSQGQRLRLCGGQLSRKEAKSTIPSSWCDPACERGVRWHSGVRCQVGPEGSGTPDDDNHGKSDSKGTPSATPPPPPDTSGFKRLEGEDYPVPPEVARVKTLPKQVVDVLKDQVFGFDTFFVTGSQPYEGGVLFAGNLRGAPEKAYEKIDRRLQDKFPGTYQLYLLTSPETEKPVAVVVPKASVEVEPTPIAEWLTATAFGITALGAIVFRNAFPLDPSTFPEGEQLISGLVDGIPGALVMVVILLAHEAGHWVVAKRVGAKLSFPFLVPSWQLGTFGAITRITNVLPSRQSLLEIAAAGPLAGSAAALVFIVIGLLLSVSDGMGISVEASAFHESLLVGGLAKLVLGDALVEGATVELNPVVLAAWSQLLVNALNSIPFGELDGGRIALSLFGRKAASRWTGASLAILGFAALFNDVALYWVALIVFLQRRPITPQANELTPPTNVGLALGSAVLFLSLAVVCPNPFNFS